MDVRKVNVVRAYMGSFMTSLEMAGVSVTLIKLASNWTEYLGMSSKTDDVTSSNSNTDHICIACSIRCSHYCPSMA